MNTRAPTSTPTHPKGQTGSQQTPDITKTNPPKGGLIKAEQKDPPGPTPENQSKSQPKESPMDTNHTNPNTQDQPSQPPQTR